MYVKPGTLFNQFNGCLTTQRLLGYIFSNASGTVPKKMEPFTYIYLKYEGVFNGLYLGKINLGN